MPRLSRPTLKPKASSAWVTALSEERDWAAAGPERHAAATASIPVDMHGRDFIAQSPVFERPSLAVESGQALVKPAFCKERSRFD
jgi:hypothetical protein